MSVRATALGAAVAFGILLAAGYVDAQDAPAPTQPAAAALASPAPVAEVPAGPATASPPPEIQPTAASPAAGGASSGTISAPVADASAQTELTEAELLDLGLGGEHPTVDTSLRFSGFADMSLNFPLNDFAKATSGGHPSFAIGNLNLYASKNLSESVRTMMEIRFTFLPNGASPVFGAPPVNTTTSDYADYNRAMRWGAIEIERVYVEWSPITYLTVRAGMFLTPYGIWNVDHGTPAIIPVTKPFIIGQNYFPERQTGLELYGRWDATNDSAFGYHLTLSNGSGPISEWKDLDDNKAIGGRAYWEYRKLGEFRLGGSAYYGRDTDATTSVIFTGETVKAAEKINIQSDMLALALDAVWKFRGWHLQAEWVSGQRNYTTAGRAATQTPAGALAFPVDTFSWGGYALAGYRFAWLGVMPFLMVGYLDQPDYIKGTAYQMGLNIRPIDSLVLKLQYDYDKFGNDITHTMIYTQLAWAF